MVGVSTSPTIDGVVMTDKALEKLFEYGPLGVICFLLVMAIAYVYRARNKDSKEYIAKLETLMANHSADMVTRNTAQQAELAAMAAIHKEELRLMQERYIETYKETTAKYYELQKSMVAFIQEFKSLL